MAELEKAMGHHSACETSPMLPFVFSRIDVEARAGRLTVCALSTNAASVVILHRRVATSAWDSGRKPNRRQVIHNLTTICKTVSSFCFNLQLSV